MSSDYRRTSRQAQANRRSVKTRDASEWRIIEFVTVVTAALAAATVLSSPSTGLWSNSNFQLFITMASLGMIAPGNFPYFLMATLASLVLAILVWRWALRTMRNRTAAGKGVEELHGLSPDHFEEWVAARFRDLGYAVKLTGMGGDHGVDILAEKPGDIVAIQCKNYKGWSVGEPALRDLLGAMQHFGADRGYLVTTGHLTPAASNWARGKPIEIWDGEYIGRLAISGRTLNPQPQRPEPKISPSASTTSVPDLKSVDGHSHCPKCGSVLVERRNRQTGETFLGCSQYPKCHFTQPRP